MEAVGCTPGQIYGTVHTRDYNHMKETQVGNGFAVDYGNWHNYSLDWEADSMKWYVDGVHYHTFAPQTEDVDKWPFKHEFYMILNVAVGGDWGGYCLNRRPPSCSDPLQFGNPQIMEVDYVRVYTLEEPRP